MNSIAKIKLSDKALSKLYKEAASYNYSEDGALNKNTIFVGLQEIKERYERTSLIGKGGSKEIFECTDLQTNRRVAMATLQDADNIHKVEDFLREARLTALLQHPNIIPIYDIALNKNHQPFFTMKLIKDGHSLMTFINRLKTEPNHLDKFPINERLELFQKVCNAMSYAHSLGVLHLDIKPSNIQLDSFGEVLLSDWGLAQLETESYAFDEISNQEGLASLNFINLTLNGMIKGTPGFMAPEQASLERQEKDKRTDIYSLGALLFTLLSFEKAIDGNDLKEILEKTRNGQIKRLVKLPESLIKVVDRAMQLRPVDRYQSVEELQQDIRAYLNGFATQAEEAGFFRLAKLFYQRNQIKCNFIILSLFLIGLISFTMMVQLRKSEQSALVYAKQAKSNEEEALYFAKEAEKSEAKLYQSLKDLEAEKEEKVYFAKISAIVNQRDGFKLFQDRKYDQAMKKFKEISYYNPELWRPWSDIACVYMSSQDFKKAQTYFQKSLKCRPNAVESRRLHDLISLCEIYQEKLEPRTGKLKPSDQAALVNILNNSGYDNIAQHIIYRKKHQLY